MLRQKRVYALKKGTNVYAFGAPLQGRTYSSGNYRYGFNGKEKDDEVKGAGNEYAYGNRIYDPRLGRFLSVDPLQKDYPFWSVYQFSGNSPIKFADLDGLEITVKGIEPLQEAFINLLSERTGLFIMKDANGVLSEISIPKNTGVMDKSGHNTFVMQTALKQADGVTTSANLRNATLRIMKGGNGLKPVTIIPTGQRKDVFFDKYSTNEFDLGDFTNIMNAPILQAALIGHIIAERAVNTTDINVAHPAAMPLENSIIKEKYPSASDRNDANIEADQGHVPPGNTNPNELYGKTFDYNTVKFKTIGEFDPTVTPTTPNGQLNPNKVRGVETHEAKQSTESPK